MFSVNTINSFKSLQLSTNNINNKFSFNYKKRLDKDSFQLSKKPSFKSNYKDNKTIQIKGKKTTAVIYTPNIDYQAYNQIKDCCDHPAFEDSPIRIMPDVHAGKDNVVGFSVQSKQKAFIPTIIGGDIGCGMLCIKIDTKGKDIDFAKLDETIRTYISGKNTKHSKKIELASKEFAKSIKDLEPETNSDKFIDELGNLGGGNHFIEIDKDSNNNLYLVIHTGSRKFGKHIADYYTNVAKQQNPYTLSHLSYLTGDEAEHYLKDTQIGKEYARLNRRAIADTILKEMDWKEISSFESVHNYISENGIVRKGAIPAYKEQQVIIPLNMRDGALIGKGKGASEWNYTAPHGAGRKYARGVASRTLSLAEYQDSMKNIYTTCVRQETIDESPQAYKDASEIIDNIDDTVEIEDIISPVYNYKG